MCLSREYFGTRGAQHPARHSVVAATTFPVEMLRRAGEGSFAPRELLTGTAVKFREITYGSGGSCTRECGDGVDGKRSGLTGWLAWLDLGSNVHVLV
jgi:hypothetical protein